MNNTAKLTLHIQKKIAQRSIPFTLDFIAIVGSLLISVIIYFYSVRNIDLQHMTDTGLISVLPWPIYVSLVLLCVSFILTLKQDTLPEPLLLLEVVLLIIMLYGVTLPVEEAPRFNVTWRHAGLVDYVQRNVPIYPSKDAYLNWPGFFILSAFVTEVTGLKSVIDLAPYASVFNNLLYLGALMLIFRSTTQNRRLAWTAIWLFYLTNWIGQDYFSPQGLNYFLYLTILGIILYWFQDTPGKGLLRVIARFKFLKFLADSPAPKRLSATVEPYPLSYLSLCLLILVWYSVPSHQLTPFAILFGVTALTLFRFNSFRYLPLIIAALILVWMIIVAAPFLKGNLGSMLQDIGQVEEAFQQGVSERLDGSPGHILIIRFRLLFTAGIWGMAFVGMFLRFRNSFKTRNASRIWSDARFLLLAFAPFALIPLQFYGGEMMLRAYLFSLPFMIFFVASLIYGEVQEDLSWTKTIATGLLSIALIGGFLLARYGNEKIDQFTVNEVEAVQYFYDHAPAGSVLVAPSPHYPAKFQGYEQYKLKFLADPILGNDVNAITDVITAKKYPEAYFIVTRSQHSFFHIFYGYPEQNWTAFESTLLDSGEFETVYTNPDAEVFKYIGSREK